MGVGWPAIQRTTFPQVVLSQKSQVSCWAFFMSTTHFSCQPTWHGWHDWFARGDIRKSIVAPRPSFEAIQVTYAPLRAIVLKNHTKKVRGSIIVYRLIQDLPFKRLDLYNSAVPHFFYSKKKLTLYTETYSNINPLLWDPVTPAASLSQPVLEAIEASHRILIQPIEDIHRMWRHTCQKIAGAGPRLETALLHNTPPETAAGDLLRIFGWKKKTESAGTCLLAIPK